VGNSIGPANEKQAPQSWGLVEAGLVFLDLDLPSQAVPVGQLGKEVKGRIAPGDVNRFRHALAPVDDRTGISYRIDRLAASVDCNGVRQTTAATLTVVCATALGARVAAAAHALPRGFHQYVIKSVGDRFEFSLDGTVRATVAAKVARATAMKIVFSAPGAGRTNR
jgi:hypothetical protein